MPRGRNTTVAAAATENEFTDLTNVVKTNTNEGIIGVVKQPPEFGTLQTFVDFYLDLLGFSIVDDEDMAHITFRKARDDDRWKPKFRVTFSVQFLKVRADLCRGGNESDSMQFTCSSLSNLRLFVREARENRAKSMNELRCCAIRSGWSERNTRELKELSSWEVASCIVMLQAINQRIVVCGVSTSGCSWAASWMLAASTRGKPIFFVGSTLRLPKGLFVNVARDCLEIMVTSTLSVSYAKLIAVPQSQACGRVESTTQVSELCVSREVPRSVLLLDKDSEISRRARQKCNRERFSSTVRTPSLTVPIYFQ